MFYDDFKVCLIVIIISIFLFHLICIFLYYINVLLRIKIKDYQSKVMKLLCHQVHEDIIMLLPPLAASLRVQHLEVLLVTENAVYSIFMYFINYL